MFDYFDIKRNNLNIKIKLYSNEHYDIDRVVLFVHGFAGHKDNSSAQIFAEKVLLKNKTTAVLVFDLPCHGDDVKNKIVLKDCLEYIDTVIEYIGEQYNNPIMYSCATSFGGYLILKYISEYGNPFKKITLRCPAVNMAQVLTNTIMTKSELEQALRGKNVAVGFDRKIEVNGTFLKDLEESDIQLLDYRKFSKDILIIHGTNDEVVSPEVGHNFAKKNNIEFVMAEGADHRFKNSQDVMEFATIKTMEFFGL